MSLRNTILDLLGRVVVCRVHQCREVCASLRPLSPAALPLLLLLAATSCAVHEWPTDTPADVVLNLDFDREMPQFMVLDVNGTRASRDGYDYVLRYTVEPYRQLPDGSWSDVPQGRYTFTKDDLRELNTTVRFGIGEGTWRFYVWTDFVLKGTEADFFYSTSSFRSIRLQGEHEGNNDFRDAFSGHADLTVKRVGSRQTPSTATVPMGRPLAKFEFVTTDLQEFITKTIEAMLRKDAESGTKAGDAAEGDTGGSDASDGSGDSGTKGDGTKAPVVDLNKYRVVFYYSGYMPCAFNMMDDKPCDSSTGVRFSSTITAVDDHEARLGFDYVFVNGKESSVMVTVGLFDEEGTQLSMSNQIEVPIKRSMLTVVKGSFLMQNTGGGVAIDPSFDGEYNIVLR